MVEEPFAAGREHDDKEVLVVTTDALDRFRLDYLRRHRLDCDANISFRYVR